MIAPGLLLTNHHCVVSDQTAAKVRIELWAEHLAGTAAMHYVEPSPVEADASLDYALLRIVATAGRRLPEPLPRVVFRAAVPW